MGIKEQLDQLKRDQTARSMSETIGNKEWVATNLDKIQAMFSTEGDEITGDFLMKVGFGLKTLNVGWAALEEVARIVIYFCRLGILQLDKKANSVRVNPNCTPTTIRNMR